MEVSFKLITGNNFHKDLIIKIFEEEFISDSYYFWNDDFDNAVNQYELILERINEYLKKWATKLKALEEDKEIFMPIDFSDEYIAGFKIKANVNLFIIKYGYTIDINDLIIQVSDSDIVTNLDEKYIETMIDFTIQKTRFLDSLYVVMI